MHYLLGVDLGTSGCKTVLFDLKGQALASQTVSYPLLQPKNGWAEQQPELWYQAALSSLHEVMQRSGVKPSDVLGLSIAGQMHGLVMLDEHQEVLRPAILWCDARCERQCQEFTQRVGSERLMELNGNPALPGFTAPKILWVQEQEPEVFAHCRTILLPKDYVRYRLTGVLKAEISDASGTNLLDLKRRVWSSELLESLGLKAELLPMLCQSCEAAGTLTKEAAEATGLLSGTLVAAGAADNAAAALGTGVCQEGSAFVTLGTSGVIFAHTRRPVYDKQGRVHTFCAAVPGAYALLSCTLSCGQSLRFGRDVMYAREHEECAQRGEEIYDYMTDEASGIPVGAEGLIYLPYLMGERSPLLDAKARGVFFGLSALHSRAHLTRAILEGVCLSQKHNLKVLEELKVVPEELRACGGGASSALFRQILCDSLSKVIKTVTSREGPALGAAILAGCAAGAYSSVEEGVAQCVRLKDEECRPDPQAQQRYEAIFELYEQLYPALKPAFAKLDTLRAELEC
ncbi:MAG: xylulokinase [Succinivibrio sp.]|nr:xylulokinase [Succinivibrio sp.]